jgi:ribonuclease HIII
MVTFEKVKKKDVEKLKEYGFSIVKTKGKYEQLRMKGPIILILFNSNKLLLQGAEDKVAEVAGLLKRLKVGSLAGKIKQKAVFKQERGIIVGSDEALKGDTFGGIVVAAVRADPTERQKLRGLGVTDSKLFNDNEINTIAEQIKKNVKYKIISLEPKEYNKMTEQYNVTGLLNLLHRDCAAKLILEGQSKHIVDLFPGCKTGDISVTKAESKYLEVAAASILARAEALKQIEKLSKRLKIKVPKGSTHVREALNHLKRKKLPFERYVKLNFRNVKTMLK